MRRDANAVLGGTFSWRHLEECSLELIDKGSNDIFRKVEKVVNVFARGGGFVERYARHSVELGLVMAWGESDKYGVFIHRPFVDMNGITTWRPEEILSADWYKEGSAVLVYVPVLLKAPEGLITVRIPSEARLVALDSHLHSVIHARHFALSTSVTELLGIVEDREGGSVVGSTTSPEHKLPCQVIKSRSEVVKDVSDHRQVGGTIGFPANFEKLVAALSVCLDDNGIWFGLSEVIEPPPEFVQMFTGPCYLDPDIVDVTHQLSRELAEGAFERIHDVYSGHGQGKAPQAANPKGTRNSHPAPRGVPSRSQEGGKGQALNPAPPTPSTSPSEHLF
jgi:hypothetical protein